MSLCTECPSLCAQTVGPRLKVKVSLESLVNGLSCPQSGRMGSDDSFRSQIVKRNGKNRQLLALRVPPDFWGQIRSGKLNLQDRIKVDTDSDS